MKLAYGKICVIHPELKGLRRNSNCISCARNRSQEWAKKNKNRTEEIKRNWYQRNKDKLRPIYANYKKEHTQENRLNSERWRLKNPEKRSATVRRHNAEKLKATPKWANKFIIEEAYDLARRRTLLKSGGHKWHVDHIVPLRSPFVCGLHVEHNLQVIPAITNQLKNNTVWPDMPDAQ